MDYATRRQEFQTAKKEANQYRETVSDLVNVGSIAQGKSADVIGFGKSQDYAPGVSEFKPNYSCNPYGQAPAT